ncbi:c-type heme family protein [Sphaerothrix gracilis]|uniref:c-type heme family protein n=1 Tax=Sphaerothrix gracilis TaxID=3151835 RepID=UPI0031FD6D64
MIKKLRLGLKFSLILGLVFIISSVLSGLLLSRTAYASAQAQVTNQALLLMETMNSVRSYTNSQINPLLTAKYDAETNFISETVPAYSAREVFETVRTAGGYKNFLYKEASDNPTNIRDRANRFELSLLERFRQQPELTEIEGLRGMKQNALFFVARPMQVNNESCLVCHSQPDRAPKSMVEKYGSEGGFDWHLNEIVAAQIMYVPASTIFSSYHQQFILMMAAFVGSSLIVILLINWLLQRNVVRPIVPLARAAQKLSNAQIDTEASEIKEIEKLNKVTQRQDEIGQLARLFQEMVESVCGRERSWRETLNKLHYETDESKQLAMLKQMTSNLNNKNLLDRSQKLRDRINSQSNS